MNSTTALIDWQKICDSEKPDRAAVIITPEEVNFSYAETAGYLDQYGIVETFRSGRIMKNSYIVIQFKDATAATNLIRQRYIVVRNAGFKVMSFHSNDELIKTVEHMTFAHPPYYAPPAPDRSEDNILNILNDDCLREVFSRMGPLTDLFPIVSVCPRFERVTVSALNSVFRKRDISFKRFDDDGEIRIWRMRNIAYTYGKSLFSVQLSEETFQNIPDKLNSILKLFNKHCPNLKKLNIVFSSYSSPFSDSNHHGKEIDNQTLVEIRPLLSKLKHFQIYHKSLSVCSDFIAACDEIEKLSISLSDNEIDSVLPGIYFSKLKCCHFEGVTDGMLEGFLADNLQIEELEIRFSSSSSCLIPEKMPNVRILNLRDVGTITAPNMLRLKCLKEAKISMHSERSEIYEGDSIKNMCKIDNIVDLELSYFAPIDWNVVVGLTKHLCNLETLNMRFLDEQTLSMDHLKEMVQYSKKLTKLVFGEMNHEFREKDYDEILEIVKNRSTHPLRLNNNLCSYKCSCPNTGRETKEIVLNTDPRWLTIINRYDNIKTTSSDESICD